MKLVRKFPEGFLWGSAPGSRSAGCGDAPDIYRFERFRTDIAQAEEMGCRCFDLSLEWKRIFPRGDELLPCEEGLRFYSQILDELGKRQIEPILTIAGSGALFCPDSGFGGWNSRRQIDSYVRYAKSLFELFGSRVKYWISFDWTEDASVYLYPAGDDLKWVERDQMNNCLQELHHRFVASAMAVRLCREMVPGSKIGCRIACRQEILDRMIREELRENVWQQKQAQFISDVLVRGGYPFYTARMFAELGRAVDMKDEDERLLSEYPADFLAPVIVEEDPQNFRLLLNRLYEHYRKPLFPEEAPWQADGPGGCREDVEEKRQIDSRKSRIEGMKEALCDGVELLGYSIKRADNCRLSENWYRQVIASNGEDLTVHSKNYLS